MLTVHPIELITLDLDETLWPCLAPIQRAEEALHDWLGQRAPRLTQALSQDDLRAHRRDLMARQPDIAHDVTAIRLTSLQLLLDEFGHDPALATEGMALFLAHRNQVEPYPDVIPVLRVLAANYRLVSVTNGNADPERTPLRGLFHRSLTAAGVGAARPDPALFQAALDWAGLAPHQALHIGDHPVYDVQAARDHGLHVLWLNREGQSWPQELEPPPAEILDLHGLLDWLSDATDGHEGARHTPEHERRCRDFHANSHEVARHPPENEKFYCDFHAYGRRVTRSAAGADGVHPDGGMRASGPGDSGEGQGSCQVPTPSMSSPTLMEARGDRHGR